MNEVRGCWAEAQPEVGERLEVSIFWPDWVVLVWVIIGGRGRRGEHRVVYSYKIPGGAQIETCFTSNTDEINPTYQLTKKPNNAH